MWTAAVVRLTAGLSLELLWSIYQYCCNDAHLSLGALMPSAAYFIVLADCRLEARFEHVALFR